VVDTLTHLPISPTTQDQITFIGVVKNKGKGPAGTSTASLKVGGETNPATFAIPQLAAGTSHVIQRQSTLGVAQNYQNTAKADIDSSVLETNETNNQRIDLYTVSVAPDLSPDLVIETFTHFPSAPTTDDEITFVAVVKNIGAGPAGATTLTFKVGGESTPPAFSVPELAPGATHTVQRKVKLGVAQNYLNTVTVDTTNAAAESNEANNQQTDHYSVVTP
jgi:subtilase family serine protease